MEFRNSKEAIKYLKSLEDIFDNKKEQEIKVENVEHSRRVREIY